MAILLRESLVVYIYIYQQMFLSAKWFLVYLIQVETKSIAGTIQHNFYLF